MALSLMLVAIVIAVLAIGYFLLMSERSQLLGYFPYQAPTAVAGTVAAAGKKIVALTFDDGPNPPDTEELLAVLAKHGVKATFFLVGANLEKYPESAKKIIAAGHVIGNHSYRHAFSKNFTAPGFAKEIDQTNALIEKNLTVKPALFRPPWLFRNLAMFRNLKIRGITPVSGLFGSELEIFQINPEQMANRALQKLRPGIILIFHDGIESRGGNRSNTVKAIDLLIPKIKARGYELTTADRILGIQPYK